MDQHDDLQWTLPPCLISNIAYPSLYHQQSNILIGCHSPACGSVGWVELSPINVNAQWVERTIRGASEGRVGERVDGVSADRGKHRCRRRLCRDVRRLCVFPDTPHWRLPVCGANDPRLARLWRAGRGGPLLQPFSNQPEKCTEIETGLEV